MAAVLDRFAIRLAFFIGNRVLDYFVVNKPVNTNLLIVYFAGLIFFLIARHNYYLLLNLY